jgi:hypothetical protein
MFDLKKYENRIDCCYMQTSLLGFIIFWELNIAKTANTKGIAILA